MSRALSTLRSSPARAVFHHHFTRSFHHGISRLLRSTTGSPASPGPSTTPNPPPTGDAASASPISTDASTSGGRTAGHDSQRDTDPSHRPSSSAGGLLPLHQFSSLASLLPSPLRSLFGRSERGRDPFTDVFRDPFFSSLSSLSPAPPSTAGVATVLPALLPLVGVGVSRGVWDVDAELVNPVQGVEVEEVDDAYVMRSKLSPAVHRGDVHLKLETAPDGQPVLHLWGEVRRRERDRRLKAEKAVYSSFQRWIILPEDVDPAAVEARFDDEHTLRLVLRKKPEAARAEGRKEIDIGGRGAPAVDEDRERAAGTGARAEQGAREAPLGGGLPGVRAGRPAAPA